MIFRAHVTGLDWLTLVVRAHTEERALALARETAGQYADDPPKVELEHLDVDGPEQILVEDSS